MGKIDNITRDYIKNPVVVADVFNYIAYNGETVIKPDNLTSVDTNSLVGIYDLINDKFLENESGSTSSGNSSNKKRNKAKNKPKAHFIDRYRDSISMLSITKDDKAIYALLGIEAQSYVNYAMPVKNMLYDALQYAVQVTNITNLLKANNVQVRDEEFLSGLRKEDRLKPVITLVVYFGTKDWDGAKKLSDLFEETDERLKPFIQDYKLTIINPTDMADEEFNKFSTDLGLVLKVLKNSSSPKHLSALINDKSTRGTLTRQGVQVIYDCLGVTVDIGTEEEEMEVKKMCSALAELIEDGRNEGKEAGLIEGRKSGLIEGRKSGLIEGRKISAIKMFLHGDALEYICDVVDTPIEQVKQWIEEAKG